MEVSRGHFCAEASSSLPPSYLIQTNANCAAETRHKYSISDLLGELPVEKLNSYLTSKSDDQDMAEEC